MPYQIEKARYELFYSMWQMGVFQGQRLGQAFFHYFNLEKMSADFSHLYNLVDTQAAADEIKRLFNFSQDEPSR